MVIERRSANDQRVRPIRRGISPTFEALCEVTEAALRAIDAAGVLDDDRPELALATLRRWCAGTSTIEEVDLAANEATESWSAGFASPAARAAYGAVDWLCLIAQDQRGTVDDEAIDHVVGNVRDTFIALGEAPLAATVKAGRLYATALRRYVALRA
jgi:hypothetical protein